MMKLNMIPTLALGLALSAPCVFAADHEESVTSDKSKNPLTGTVTETSEYKKKDHNAIGSAAKHEVKKTKKTFKDGSTKTTTETDSAAEH